MNKYGNKKIEIDGIGFDSLKEGKRFRELRLLQKAGKIGDINVHSSYILQERFNRENGKWVRTITYEADFEYFQKEMGNTIVEEVKGFKTEGYKIKRMMFLKQLKPRWIFVEL